MKRNARLPVRLVVVLSATLAGCGSNDENVALGESREPFSTSPGEPNHEEITASGLSFLKLEILSAIQAANVATDVELALVNANHFDDCNFSGGADVVRASQAEAVAALDPAQPSGQADLLAIRAWGRSLHALQDFYAHTNWIELGGDTLIDSALTQFPSLTPYSTIPASGFVVVQGEKPKQAALSRDEKAPYPKSAVVSVKLGPKPGPLGKTRAHGLISGTVDYEAGDFCPRSVAMTHDELNKDKSTLMDRSQQYEAARTLATLQTEHEWCRLRALTQRAWGDAGLARLDGWAAEGAVAPTCDSR
jgi:hypothetical protein